MEGCGRVGGGSGIGSGGGIRAGASGGDLGDVVVVDVEDEMMLSMVNKCLADVDWLVTGGEHLDVGEDDDGDGDDDEEQEEVEAACGESALGFDGGACGDGNTAVER